MARSFDGLRGVGIAALMSSAALAVPTLVPIGGDYNTVADFVRVVSASATGRSIDIVVIPSTYADTKAEAMENGDYELALEHVSQLEQACAATVDLARFPEGCRASLVDLWVRSDADDAAVAGALGSAELDGAFILGGDQEAGMLAMAGSAAERALAASYARGAVVGGTSAGNAVLSTTMSDGYTDYGDSSVALQLGAIDMWFGGADPLHRGLSFGSKRAVFDQHLYQRGRFGRLLNETARTADRFGGGGLLGIGVDLDTAPVVRDDRWISEVFGASSLSIIDFRTLGARWSWVDGDGRAVPNPTPETTPTAALSARNVLVHVLAPRQGPGGIAYELAQRTPVLDRTPVHYPGLRAPPLDLGDLRAARPLILGGDLSMGPTWPEDSKVLRELIARAGATGPMLVVAAGYTDPEAAQEDLGTYLEALALSGWTGATVTRVFPEPVSDAELARAAGVILLGADQGQLPALLADRRFERLVRGASRLAPVLMLERSIVAMAGDVYDGVDDAADWIDAWKESQANIQRGLGLVRASRPVAFEPRLQWDYRWGRLFGIPFAAPGRRPVALGISEGSAIVVTSCGATVVGLNPVIAVDTGASTFYHGSNGAFGVLNAVLDVYEPKSRGPRPPRAARTTSLLSRDSSDLPAARRR